jgi:hypothetical protein
MVSPFDKLRALSLSRNLSNHYSDLKIGVWRRRTYQLARRDSMIFILEALTAGNTPPTKPMIKEKAMDFQAMSRVRVKSKASSEKV